MLLQVNISKKLVNMVYCRGNRYDFTWARKTWKTFRLWVWWITLIEADEAELNVIFQQAYQLQQRLQRKQLPNGLLLIWYGNEPWLYNSHCKWFDFCQNWYRIFKWKVLCLKKIDLINSLITTEDGEEMLSFQTPELPPRAEVNQNTTKKEQYIRQVVLYNLLQGQEQMRIS